MGAGLANSISGSSVTYAIGGAGALNGYSTVGPAGTANRGIGGSGGNGGLAAGGSGGSGIVIIRYSNTYADATSTTGSPTFTNTGGYKIYTFTGSGSITF
jgi:hypothetical protein